MARTERRHFLLGLFPVGRRRAETSCEVTLPVGVEKLQKSEVFALERESHDVHYAIGMTRQDALGPFSRLELLLGGQSQQIALLQGFLSLSLKCRAFRKRLLVSRCSSERVHDVTRKVLFNPFITAVHLGPGLF